MPVTITNNFYAPIGQHIDHVDRIEAHFDKDGQMHVNQISDKEDAQQMAAPSLCSYIIPNDIKPMEEIEKEMKLAAETSAPALVNYLKMADSLGYIKLPNDAAKTIYENLKQHFGLKYSYSNWMLYY